MRPFFLLWEKWINLIPVKKLLSLQPGFPALGENIHAHTQSGHCTQHLTLSTSWLAQESHQHHMLKWQTGWGWQWHSWCSAWRAQKEVLEEKESTLKLERTEDVSKSEPWKAHCKSLQCTQMSLVIQTLITSRAGFNQQVWCMSSPRQSAQGRKGRGWGDTQKISIVDKPTCGSQQDQYLTLRHETLKVSLDMIISCKHLVNTQSISGTFLFDTAEKD